MDYLHYASSQRHRSSKNDVLKLIAMLTMLIDHIGVLFFPEIRFLRTIGRIAFPIFTYQLAIGYQKTHSRLNYAKRLSIFAVVSQIPYTFLSKGAVAHVLHFNVLFLFLYGLLILFLHDTALNTWHALFKRFAWQDFLKWSLQNLLFLGCLFLPMILEIMYVDFAFSYSTYGLMILLLFHRFRQHPIELCVGYIILSFCFPYLNGGIYFIGQITPPLLRLKLYLSTLYVEHQAIWQNIMLWRSGPFHLEGYFFQARSIVSLAIIGFLEYLEPRFHMPKYIAYAFYPGHIALLLAIHWMML